MLKYIKIFYVKYQKSIFNNYFEIFYRFIFDIHLYFANFQ